MNRTISHVAASSYARVERLERVAYGSAILFVTLFLLLP